jgi:peptide-methionine (R)-S-oxide reductase
MQFDVLRLDGTERPFKNPFHDYKADGVYACAGCGNKLFDSKTKFDSRTGWPSFYQPVAPEHVTLQVEDDARARTEVSCAGCEGHLGHVFDDAPQTPTGLRYCMNSAAMVFHPRTTQETP